MKNFIHIFLIFIVGFNLYSQTLPPLFKLKDTSYVFTKWSPEQSPATYPDNMIFHQTSSADPGLNDKMNGDWVLPYNLTSGSRICGMDTMGISFLNTSVKNDDGGYLGAAVLGLNTKDCYNIKVSWTGRTFKPNERIYSIALQYKSGNNEYKNSGVVYIMGDTDNHSTEFKDIVLPNECEDNDTIYLRWKYFFTSNDEGARAELGIDDIKITAESSSDVNKQVENNSITFQKINGKIHIDIENNISEQYEIHLYNLRGDLLIVKDISLPYALRTAFLPKGIYFLQIYFNGYKDTYKFIN